MVFNATSNNISVDIVVVSFTEGENNRPAASHLQTLSHNT